MAQDDVKKFITTEPLGRGGERHEAKVWDAVAKLLLKGLASDIGGIPFFQKWDNRGKNQTF